MNLDKQLELLNLFKDFITKIEKRKVGGWRIKVRAGLENGLTIRCDNATRNFIDDIPKSTGVISIWNAKNKDCQIKEVRKYCIEDTDRYTLIYWELDFI